MPTGNENIITIIEANDLLVQLREWANSKFVEQITGKGLSANDFTNALKDKLDGIANGAEVNALMGVKLNSVELVIDANRKVNIDLSAYALKSDIASAYIPKGDIQASALVSALLIEDNIGDVYNLSDTLTITASNVSLFKNGVVGQSFPEGTNVVIVKDGNNYLFDVLEGFVDLSNYYTKSEVNSLLADKANAIHSHVVSDITNLHFMTASEARAILEA